MIERHPLLGKLLLVPLLLVLAGLLVLLAVHQRHTTTSPAPNTTPSPAAVQQPGARSPATPNQTSQTVTIPTQAPATTSNPTPVSHDDGARSVLQSVIPAWASNNYAQGISMNTWGDTFNGLPGVSSKFYNESRNNFNTLWNGAYWEGFSAPHAKIVEAKKLWESNNRSLWRVEVQRQLVPLTTNGAPATTENLTWDFLIDYSDGTPTLAAFSDPDPGNLKPTTYKLPAGAQ